MDGANNREEVVNADANPAESEDRSSLLQIIGNAVGMDLTKFALPVYYNEPISMLQRLCEFMQYSYLLDLASDCDDPVLRVTYVAAFAVSTFSSTERTQKPFNPLLGETFELVDKERGFRFVAEQVSHHPPIGASHCESDKWELWQDQMVSSIFRGNSLDVTPKGVTYVFLKRHGEYYKWPNIKTVVHNIIIGRVWVDHYGDTTVSVSPSLDFAKPFARRVDLNYKQCGWFSRGYREVVGTVYDDNNAPVYKLAGKWNDQITCVPITSALSHGNIVGPTVLWKHTVQKSSNPRFAKLGWSEYTAKLVKYDDELLNFLPVTDSRLRPDRMALERGNISEATKAKHELEQRQRAQRRVRQELKLTYKPQYFELRTAGENGFKYWHFNGKYWTDREQRGSQPNPEKGKFYMDGGLPPEVQPTNIK